MKVGDVVRWTLPDGFRPPEKGSPTLGVIVEMHIGNGANVAWLADGMRVTWVPLLELEVISESG